MKKDCKAATSLGRLSITPAAGSASAADSNPLHGRQSQLQADTHQICARANMSAYPTAAALNVRAWQGTGPKEARARCSPHRAHRAAMLGVRRAGDESKMILNGCARLSKLEETPDRAWCLAPRGWMLPDCLLSVVGTAAAFSNPALPVPQPCFHKRMAAANEWSSPSRHYSGLLTWGCICWQPDMLSKGEGPVACAQENEACIADKSRSQSYADTA